MRHPETLIVPFVRRELSDGERERLQAHVAACAACARAVDETRAVLARLAAALPAPPAVDWTRWTAELRARRQARTTRRRPAWLAPLPLALSGAVAAALLLLSVDVVHHENALEPLSPDEAVIGRRLDLLRHYPVVERLDLLEDLDVIRHLDTLPVRDG